MINYGIFKRWYNISYISLKIAKERKDDEFYTLYSDIEKELNNYKDFFKGKIIFLNCNDANKKSDNFFRYFKNNYKIFGIKQLLAADYENNFLINFDGIKETINKIDADCFSNEMIDILRKADIIITNPPFSKLKDFIEMLVKEDKKFLIVANENCYSATKVFPYVKQRKFWCGYNKIKSFQWNSGEKKFGNICWITNLPVFKKKELIFTEKYSKEKYPKYDNYDAINIDRIKDIPIDYDGIMGVPISIINQLPKEYEILGMASGNSRNNELYGEVNYIYNNSDHGGAPMVNGKRKYTRIFIRKILWQILKLVKKFIILY